uniref:ARID domain-containing protein n=1 Tax=Dendroctonus ponderosae TaxID=77166 RepID=A0AAR5PEB9_DENPD
MQADDPPYLPVGTAVSAKYKGAFCEAKVSKVDRIVKCKVTFKSGLGAATVSDNEIKGTLRVGQQVLVKHNDHKELVEATITKIQDCSQYTVVFDDGDITTLRRTALCLKSGRHFNESETLDQLPLTHPEHFGIPVMGGRRGRRNRLLKDESSDDEIEEENEPDLEGYTQDIGRVVSVETGETKRGKEKWFPGLIVIPSAQPTVKINVKDEFLIRSFRDDRYYTVPKKEVSEFNKELSERIESSGLAEAIQKANKFLNGNDLPLHWEKSSLFNLSVDSDSDDNASDTSDEEQSEEKDRFVAQLYKYMDDSGTPLNKTPTISSKDIDLHRLFRVVHKMGGCNRVTNQNKWKSVATRMKLTVNQNVSNQVKSVYKKCLLSYEGFFRTLGVTMSNPTRPTKKDKGRSLIRDKDRTPINQIPVSSPRPEREDDMPEKLVERKSTPLPEIRTKKKSESKEKDVVPKKPKSEPRDPGSDFSDTPSTSGMRSKRQDVKVSKEKKIKTPQGEKIKMPMEKFEDYPKKEEKVQFTRSKSSSSSSSASKLKDVPKEVTLTRPSKESPAKCLPKSPKKGIKEEEGVQDKDKKPKIKKASEILIEPHQTANIGDKLIVYYGPTNESKVTYEAKVVDMDKDQTGPIYLVHYTGWNTRYDEWIPACRVAENLSSGAKSKRSKVPAPVNVKPGSSGGPSASFPKLPSTKRNRLTSVSSREEKPPRSTTPSSGASSSSTSKSPATCTVRSSRLAAKQEAKKRRISGQTDAFLPSESDSDSCESEAELPRTRSGSLKTEDADLRVYRKRQSRSTPTSRQQKRKEDGNKDEPSRKKAKKYSAGESDEEEESLRHPRGRDFDLNEIRNELKGISQAIKPPSAAGADKDAVPSEEGFDKVQSIKEELIDVKVEEDPTPKLSPKAATLEPSCSSEDIYEFKEPEPFEFEARAKLGDDKTSKKRLPRLFEPLEDKSPRKRTGALSPLSPVAGKSDKLDHPEPRTYSRAPKKMMLSDDEDEDEDIMDEEGIAMSDINEDPFDKLIESPSFNLSKTGLEPVVEKPVALFAETSAELFKEPGETSDEYSRDMELSDCESQTQIYSRGVYNLFTGTFSKSPNERNTPDFASSKTDEGKTTNSDDDEIQAQIQRAIDQSSSTDDDSSSVLIDIPLAASSSPKTLEDPSTSSSSIVPALSLSAAVSVIAPSLSIRVHEMDDVIPEPPNQEPIEAPAPPPPSAPSPGPVADSKPHSPKKPIDPALQETDSSLLESIVSKPPLILNPMLDDTGKELTVKTGTRIADSILQKFNFIKNNIETKGSKVESPVPLQISAIEKLETRTTLSNPGAWKQDADEAGPSTSEVKESEDEPEEDPRVKPDALPRRHRGALSKAIVEDSDSDSSDSENLVIRSEDEDDDDDDDDSQTNSSDNKPLIECKNTDSNMSSLQKTLTTTDESQSQSQPPEEEKRNFSFDSPPEVPEEEEEVAVGEEDEAHPVPEKKPEPPLEVKEDDQNLLCLEVLPRSPASVPDFPGPSEAPSTSSVHEMPFASAPGSSNSKILLETKKHQPPPLLFAAERGNRADAPATLENSAPTTPESTISNLSPRGENGTASPNSNDSKSNEGEPGYGEQRRSAGLKVSHYCEEDAQPGSDVSTSRKATDSFGPPMVHRKRRRSLRNSEDGCSGVAVLTGKRGRKPRQRRDSDSDDASESSMAGSGTGGTTPGSTTSMYDRSARSPRPSKYNFFVEFDPSLDSSQRIAVLQQKLSELRKTYADVKAELATVERRRKKLRRREREALKTAKQELACT